MKSSRVLRIQIRKRLSFLQQQRQEVLFRQPAKINLTRRMGQWQAGSWLIILFFSRPCTRVMAGVSKSMVFISGTHTKRSPRQKLLRLVMGAIIIATIIWGLYMVPYDILREERFRLFGEERTTGLVLSVHTDDTAQDLGSRFVIEYKYVDMDGFVRTTTAPLPHKLWQKYRPGSSIKVIYPRTQPRLARVPNEIEPPFQIWLRRWLQ